MKTKCGDRAAEFCINIYRECDVCIMMSKFINKFKEEDDTQRNVEGATSTKPD